MSDAGIREELQLLWQWGDDAQRLIRK